MPVGDYTIWRIAGHLFRREEYIVGSIIVVFAGILPLVSLVLCALLALPADVGNKRLDQLARRIGSLAKWSMGNVFLASLLIILVSAPDFYLTIRAEAGLYCYAAAVLGAMMVTGLLNRDPRTTWFTRRRTPLST